MSASSSWEADELEGPPLGDSMWQLSKPLRNLLLRAGWRTGVLIEASVDKSADLLDLLEQADGGRSHKTVRDLWIQELHRWLPLAQRAAKRFRTSVVLAGCDQVEEQRRRDQRSLQEDDRGNLHLALRQLLEPKAVHWKSRYIQKIDELADPDERRNKTQREHAKYTQKLVDVLVSGDLPVVAAATNTADPEQALKRIFGKKRLRTLRARYNVWRKIQLWLTCVLNIAFPGRPEHMIDYMEEMARGDMGRSVPGSVAATLSFLEKAGGVEPARRISQDHLWLATVSSLSSELRKENNLVRKAPQPLVIVIIALELAMISELPVYAKFVAWVILIKIWAVFRTGDLIYICPRRLSLTRRCLRGVVTQTKTSGPEKKIGELPFWLSRNIGLTGVDWLQLGFDIWRTDHFYKGGDYFVPMPNADFTGTRKTGASEAQIVSLCKKVLSTLTVPKLIGGKWRSMPSGARILPYPLILYWQGHSERHFIPNVGAADTIPKQDIDTTGRWGISAAQSSDYVNSARHVVLKIQDQVCRAIVEGPTNYDEEELILDAEEFLRKRLKVSVLPESLDRLKVLKGRKGLGRTFPISGYDVTVDPAFQPGDDEADKAEEAIPISTLGLSTVELREPETGEMWMSVSRSGFRRLHRARDPVSARGMICPVRAKDCLKFEICKKGTEKADKACKFCFPNQEEAHSESESSNSEESESTDSDSGSSSGSGGIDPPPPPENVSSGPPVVQVPEDDFDD